MLRQAQRVVIAAFACLAILLAWLDRSLSEYQGKNATVDNGSELTRLTDWLTHDAAGLFTSLLVVVGISQLVLFYVQLKLIRRSLTDAEKAADAAEGAASAAKIQADIAQKTLTNVQRPYVFIFDISRLMTRDDVSALTPFVEYDAANFGQTPAIIENVGAGFHEGTLPDVPVRVDEDHNLFVSPILAPGERRKDLKELLPEAFIGENLGVIVDQERSTTHPIPKIANNEELFFRVIVYYRGPFSDGHKTSATWIYHRAQDRFVQFGGRDYNYTE
jgi:hypothetical protein